MAEHVRAAVAAGVAGLGAHGFVVPEDLSLTETGANAYRRLVEAGRTGLEKLLTGWPPEQQAEMGDTISALADGFLSDDFDEKLATVRERSAAAIPA